MPAGARDLLTDASPFRAFPCLAASSASPRSHAPSPFAIPKDRRDLEALLHQTVRCARPPVKGTDTRCSPGLPCVEHRRAPEGTHRDEDTIRPGIDRLPGLTPPSASPRHLFLAFPVRGGCHGRQHRQRDVASRQTHAGPRGPPGRLPLRSALRHGSATTEVVTASGRPPLRKKTDGRGLRSDDTRLRVASLPHARRTPIREDRRDARRR